MCSIFLELLIKIYYNYKVLHVQLVWWQSNSLFTVTVNLKFLNSCYLIGTAKARLAMCDHELGCAVSSCNVRQWTHIGWNLRCACVQCIFRLAKCNRNLAHFLGKMQVMNTLSLGVNCNSISSSKIEDFSN